MKCRNCGARIKKSEEICPECGKYSSDKQSTEISRNANSEPRLGKFINSFDYKDSLASQSFSIAVLGLLLSAPMLIEIIKFITTPYFSMFKSFSIKDIIMIIIPFILGIAIIVISTVWFFNSRKCFVSVYENGLSGLVPSSPFTTVPFDILFEDIKEIKRKGFYAGRYATPHIIIKTADIKIQIAFPEKKHTTKLSDHLYSIYDK